MPWRWAIDHRIAGSTDAPRWAWSSARGMSVFLGMLVVMTFFNNIYAVRMRFFQASVCDLNKSGLLWHVRDGAGADIAHAAGHTARDLENHVFQLAFVWCGCLHSFRHIVFSVFLEISV